MDKFEKDIEEFLTYLKIDKKYSLNTINAYKNDLEKYYKYMKNNNKTIDTITRKEIESYLKYLNTEKLSMSTISHNISTIRSFYKFLAIDKNLKNNPIELIELPKLKKKNS